MTHRSGSTEAVALKAPHVLGPFLSCLLLATGASAQTSATPPADIKEAVSVPTVAGEAPIEIEKPSTDSINAAVSAGGQIATGNSKSVAASGLGKFDIRRGNNAFALSLGGNYAEAYTFPTTTYTPTITLANGTKTISTTAAPSPGLWKESVENLQGKIRYDRYFSRNFSAFLQLTGTHDAFQAVTFRLNVDPGVKLLVVQQPDTKIWGELGYDFQFDDNYTDSNGIEQAGAGGPALDSTGAAYVLPENDTIHSGRAFAGFQHHFNKDVILNAGLEYLQGFGGNGGNAPGVPKGYNAIGTANTAQTTWVDPQGISLTGSRLNFDVLLAAKLGAGLSFGVGFSAKYNSAPLAGKTDMDTSTTLTLIYSFGSAGKKEEAPKPPPPCAPAPVLTIVPAPTTGPVPPAPVPPAPPAP